MIVCSGTVSIFTFLSHCFDCVLRKHTLNSMIALPNWVLIRWPVKWSHWWSVCQAASRCPRIFHALLLLWFGRRVVGEWIGLAETPCWSTGPPGGGGRRVWVLPPACRSFGEVGPECYLLLPCSSSEGQSLRSCPLGPQSCIAVEL